MTSIFYSNMGLYIFIGTRNSQNSRKCKVRNKFILSRILGRVNTNISFIKIVEHSFGFLINGFDSSLLN